MNQFRVADQLKLELSDVGAEAFAEIMSGAYDLRLIVGTDNVVESISASTDRFENYDFSSWRGREFTEIVTEESVAKVERMFREARDGTACHRREINHILDNAELPLSYSAIRMAGTGAILLLGKDLEEIAHLQTRLVNAQMALEQDYERMRQVEARYRVLFETTTEALVVLKAETLRVLDVNRRAASVLQRPAAELTDSFFPREFAPSDRKVLEDTLNMTASSGQSQKVKIERKNQSPVVVEADLFRAASENLIMCRISDTDNLSGKAGGIESSMISLYRDSGDAILITDLEGGIRHANNAFQALVDVPLNDDLSGRMITDFLGRPAIDFKVMKKHASDTGRMRMYATTMRGLYGSEVAVEISTTHLGDTLKGGFAFVIRDVSRFEASRERSQSVSPEAVEHVVEMVGSAPLKELVRATTDVVEKMCIETAINLTGNNRAAAAEMLGLSRQSLYVKLRKFGLLEAGDEDE